MFNTVKYTTMQTARGHLLLISADEEIRAKAAAREKALADLESSLAWSREEGLAKGRAEERENAIINMIKNGISQSTIVACGYDKAEITKAAKKHGIKLS